jgi:hypothetical protein
LKPILLSLLLCFSAKAQLFAQEAKSKIINMDSVRRQMFRDTAVYYQETSLIEKYHGKKIKRVLVNYYYDQVVVFLRGAKGPQLTRREAIREGILPPPAAMENIYMDSTVYIGISNKTKLPGAKAQKPKLEYDDGDLSKPDSTDTYSLNVFVPDSTVVYELSKKTKDTITAWHFKVGKIPPAELKKPKVSIGDMIGIFATPDNFKAQKEIKVEKGYEFIRAGVYFVGTGFPAVQVRPLYTADLSPLRELYDLCSDGTSIIFNPIMVKTPYGRIIAANPISIKLSDKAHAEVKEKFQPEFSFGEITSQRAPAKVFRKQKEIKVSDGYTFESGTIYFSGAGFSPVAKSEISNSDLTQIKDLMVRCVPGTIVVLENIIVKSPSGEKIADLNYAILLY